MATRKKAKRSCPYVVETPKYGGGMARFCHKTKAAAMRRLRQLDNSSASKHGITVRYRGRAIAHGEVG